MEGYPDMSFRPLNDITRAEAIATLDRAITTPSQATTGTISGIVNDGTYPVSGATVSATTVDGAVYSATTGTDGSYSIADVPAGSDYTVTASGTGYQDSTANNVTVTAGQTTSGVDFTLTQ